MCWAPATWKLQLENPCNLKLITSPSTSISFPPSFPTTSECNRFLGRWGKAFWSQLGLDVGWDLDRAGMLGLGCCLLPAPRPQLCSQQPSPSQSASPPGTEPQASCTAVAARWICCCRVNILFPLQFSSDTDWRDRWLCFRVDRGVWHTLH